MAIKLTPGQTTGLKKVCEEATANAAKHCMSPVSGEKIDVGLSGFSVQIRTGLSKVMGDPSEKVTVARIPLEGANRGDVLLITSTQKAAELADIFCGLSVGTTDEVNDYVESLILEVGKIPMMIYVNALMKQAKSMCTEGIPTVSSGPWNQLDEEVLGRYSTGDKVIQIGLNFSSEALETSGLEVIDKENLTDRSKPGNLVIGDLKLSDFKRFMKTGKVEKSSEEHLHKASIAISDLVSLMPSKIQNATKTLCDMGPAAVAPLIAAVKQSTAKTRFTLIEALVALGKPAVPALNEALDGADPETSRTIGVTLERIEGMPQEPTDSPEKAEQKSKDKAENTEGVVAHLLIVFERNDMDNILAALG